MDTIDLVTSLSRTKEQRAALNSYEIFNLVRSTMYKTQNNMFGEDSKLI